MSSEKNISQPNLHYCFVEDIIVNRLTGEILTVIDSAIVELKQNKAVKDLIKNRIRSTVSDIQDTACRIDKDTGKGDWGNSINFPSDKS